MHDNDVFFYFLKIIFDIITSKWSKKYKSHLILTKKKLNFFRMPKQPFSHLNKT